MVEIALEVPNTEDDLSAHGRQLVTDIASCRGIVAGGSDLEDEKPEWTAHLVTGKNWHDYDPYGSQNIPQELNRQCRAGPGRAVLNFESNGWITRGELDGLVSRVAKGLREIGVSKGDRIVLSSLACLDHIAILLATIKVGGIAVPINPYYTRGEFKRVVRLVRPVAVYATDSEALKWAGEEAPSTTLIGSLADLERVDDLKRVTELVRSDPAIIFMTSGTTGDPKGVVLSHGNLLGGARAVAVAWRWSMDDLLILHLPLFHVHGLAIGLLGTLLVGGSAIIHRKFDVESILEAVVEHEPTMIFGVPTTYARLLSDDRVGRLATLRLCVCGSAPLPATLFERFYHATGHRLLERYGMTESLLVLSNPYDGPRREGKVGVPLPGVEARVETLKSVDDGGELLIRGPSVFSGYWKRPDLAKQVFTDDGWLRTGDLASRDEDRYFRVIGRLNDIIITGGENVYPGEIEAVLRRHGGVRDVAVVGVPSDTWGEEIVAAVVANRSLPQEELAAIAAAELVSFKRPKRYVYLETLPVNAMGKVDRNALKAQL